MYLEKTGFEFFGKNELILCIVQYIGKESKGLKIISKH